MSLLKVHSIYHYPVKSCAPVQLQSAQITPSGFLNDRRWMVVDSETGKFVTQRKDVKMARLQAGFSDGVLALSYSDGASSTSLDVEITKTTEISTEVWGDTPYGWDQGDQVASWLSEILGKSVRLAYIDDDQLRRVDPDYADASDQVGFADGFPFLITTTSSIEQFNRDLGYDISITRFRPNIVIQSDSLDSLEPYAEDNWKSISINGIQFDLVKPCSRCVMPSINPDSLEKERSVIETLVATRKKENATYFGQNALHRVKEGLISVGDTVEILEIKTYGR